MSRHYLLDHTMLDFKGDDRLFFGDDGAPVNAMHGGFGKWGRTGTPFICWDWALDSEGYRMIVCVGEEKDLDRSQWPLCEMCEKSRHLWVHTMVHPEFADRLAVGRCCAGHMANDLEGVRRYEKEAKLVATISAGALWKGDDFQQRGNIGRFWMTARRFGNGNYRCELWHQGTKYRRQSNRAYGTMEAAKRAVVRGVVKSRMTGSWKQA